MGFNLKCDFNIVSEEPPFRKSIPIFLEYVSVNLCNEDSECREDSDCETKEFKSCSTLGYSKEYNDFGNKCIKCECVPLCRWKETDIIQHFYGLKE